MVDPEMIDAEMVDPDTVDPDTVDPDTVDPDTVDPDTVDPDTVDAMRHCPNCHAAVTSSEQFCEACGAQLSPTVADEPAQPDAPTQVMTVSDDLDGTAATCLACGGEVSSDGYCGTCGTRAPTLRDHFTEQPAVWVAAVCDRGIRHARNEDAVALAADSEPGSRAVLVVCDGVSNSVDSDVASLAAARTARDVLASSRSRGMGTKSSLVGAVIARIEAATDAASEAVLEVTRTAKVVATGGNPASCTFVAAVVEQDLLVVGSVGDSRAYWLPDEGTAITLTVDDSFAQEQIASGVPRAEAEKGPQSHAITRWLGVDAPDHTPTTAKMTLAEPGWLLVCTDGLWNYCSPAQDLATLVLQSSSTSPAAGEPLALAGALVDWAIAQGGQDNITVALARIQPAGPPSRPAASLSPPAASLSPPTASLSPPTASPSTPAAPPSEPTAPPSEPTAPPSTSTAPRSTPKGSPQNG